MNWKTWVPLALAIVLGVVAMKIAKDMTAKKSDGAPAQQTFVEAVVARQPVAPGTALRPEDLTISKMPAEVSGDSIFRRIDELRGRVVTAPLVKGQPVLRSLLAPEGTGTGLQALVPRGMRAITLEINEFSGVAGFLVPGCNVDVVSTINADGGDTVSRTVVQNVKVTALGARRQNDSSADAAGEPTRSVTLLVTPKQAEAIELAASTGRPRLVLRSSGDDSTTSSAGVTVAELRGDSRRKLDPFALPVELFRPSRPTTQPFSPTPVAAAAEPAHRQHTVRVIRGGVESNVTMTLPVETRPEDGGRFITDAKN